MNWESECSYQRGVGVGIEGKNEKILSGESLLSVVPGQVKA